MRDGVAEVKGVLIVAVALAGCAPTAIPRRADHPASSTAAQGRLAGPPAALREGVVAPSDGKPAEKPAEPPAPHDHNHDHGRAGH
jgi:hypothetical protein